MPTITVHPVFGMLDFVNIFFLSKSTISSVLLPKCFNKIPFFPLKCTFFHSVLCTGNYIAHAMKMLGIGNNGDQTIIQVYFWLQLHVHCTPKTLFLMRQFIYLRCNISIWERKIGLGKHSEFEFVNWQLMLHKMKQCIPLFQKQIIQSGHILYKIVYSQCYYS